MSSVHIATATITLLMALLMPGALHAQDAPSAPEETPPAAVEEAPVALEEAPTEAAIEEPLSAAAEEAAVPEDPTPADDGVDATEASPPLAELSAFGDGEPLPEPELDESASGDSDDGEISTAVWATAGIAAGSVIVGTVFGFLALSEQAAFEDVPTEQKADRGETYALLADVFLFTALASGVTALVLHYGRRSRDDDDDEIALDISPVVGRRAGGLSARMRF